MLDSIKSHYRLRSINTDTQTPFLPHLYLDIFFCASVHPRSRRTRFFRTLLDFWCCIRHGHLLAMNMWNLGIRLYHRCHSVMNQIWLASWCHPEITGNQSSQVVQELAHLLSNTVCICRICFFCPWILLHWNSQLAMKHSIHITAVKTKELSKFWTYKTNWHLSWW